MIVTCEACFTSFNLNDELIKVSGTKVRCSKCQKVFKVFPYDPEEKSEPSSSETSDIASKYSLSPPLFETSAFTESGDGLKHASFLSPESPVLPEDFKDIIEFDFSDLDKLLQEDGNVKPENALADPQEDLFSAPSLSSGDASESLDISEAPDTLSESDLFDISIDLPEVREPQDEPVFDISSPVLMETDASETLPDKSDELFEPDFSEISFDESIEGAKDQVSDVPIEAETDLELSESELQDLSLDDFEKSLEMDFSDISLVSTGELETADDQIKESAETHIKWEPTLEDAPVSEDTISGFNDIETLDLTDIESLIEKKEEEVSSSDLNAGADSFLRADSVIVSPPDSSTETDDILEMDDQYLTFDELQLDLGDSKSATLQEIKESFKPALSETAIPAATSLQAGSVGFAAEPEEKEIAIPVDADIDERLEDADPEPKKGISPPILILLILAVIVAAAYGGYKLLTSMGIAIPFISQPEPSKVSDPGNLNIKAADISSKFIDNTKIGKLFVITGKVKNEYPAARGAIQIAGKIYTKDKALAKTETVFCGNILSDADLAGADAATLRQRLQNKSGDNHANQKVLPGTSIPFMIVFSNLPANMEEFTTEVVSSVAS